MVSADGDGDGPCDFAAWAESFRADAEADDYAILREHLRRLNLPDEPLLLLEGTISFVVMWAAFYSCGRASGFARLLKMQTYDPTRAEGACYAYTFNVCDRTYARVFVDKKYGNLDLADMNEARWNDHEVAGYRSIMISHPDWSPLDEFERDDLVKEASNDLYYDYSEQELDITVECEMYDSFDETYLCIHVQEIPVEDQEDEEEEEDEEDEEETVE